MNKTYTALMFLEDLKLELQKIITSYNKCEKVLSYRKLSEILNNSPDLAYRIRKNSKRNSNFQLSLKDLELIKSNLLNKLLDKSSGAIKLIEKHKSLNNVKKNQ